VIPLLTRLVLEAADLAGGQRDQFMIIGGRRPLSTGAVAPPQRGQDGEADAGMLLADVPGRAK